MKDEIIRTLANSKRGSWKIKFANDNNDPIIKGKGLESESDTNKNLVNPLLTLFFIYRHVVGGM